MRVHSSCSLRSAWPIPLTARKRAAAVSEDQGPAQRSVDQPPGPADVQHLAVAAQHRRDDHSVAGQPADRGRGEQIPGIQQPGTDLITQLLPRQGHHQMRLLTTAVGQFA